MNLQETANAVAEEMDAEIYLYAGLIVQRFARQLVDIYSENSTKPNALLILETYGGDPGAAYQIVSFLRARHPNGKLILFVDGICKSAGTLVALGADVLVMSDYAELGPLDTQVEKPDEIGGYYSGLVAIKALDVLREQSFLLFEDHLTKLVRTSGLQLTTRTAELASSLATGLFNPIYEQIDPLRLGENQRAMEVSFRYGEVLRNQNVRPDTVSTLVSGYPSHSYVIDRTEAESLFYEVHRPSNLLLQLASSVRPIIESKLYSGGEPASIHLTWREKARPQEPIKSGEQNDEEMHSSSNGREESAPVPGADKPEGNGSPQGNKSENRQDTI